MLYVHNKHAMFAGIYYCCIPETRVWQTLSLADEYDVKCVLQRCENWLLTGLDFKVDRLRGTRRITAENQQAGYLVECLHYGEKYNLKTLHSTVFEKLVKYKFRSYKDNLHYKSLSETSRLELLEARLNNID